MHYGEIADDLLDVGGAMQSVGTHPGRAFPDGVVAAVIVIATSTVALVAMPDTVNFLVVLGGRVERRGLGFVPP